MSELKYAICPCKVVGDPRDVDTRGSEACFVYDDKVVHREASFMKNQPEHVYPMSKIQEVYYHGPSFFSNEYIRLTIAGSGYIVINAYSEKKGLKKEAAEYIQNRISELSNSGPMSNEQSAMSVTTIADELMSLKKLLDAGVITQEDFEAKKKQLLQL